VKVSNNCGSLNSDTATITPTAPPVCVAPQITQQPAGGTINSGQTFSMNVQASGTSLSIQWYEGQKATSRTP